MSVNKKIKAEVRWYLKKISRLCVSNGSKLFFSSLSRQTNAVRVLTYHVFGDQKKNPFCVTADDFEAQMSFLAREHRAISLQQLLDHLVGKVKIPANACLVTIDDGMISTLDTALPILEKYEIPAIAFVSSKLVGKGGSSLSERYMTWDELNQLTRSGLVSIGSHAHTHRSMDQLSDEELRFELDTSRKLLGERLNRNIIAFAYPFGMRKDFSPRTDRAIQASGYEIGFNSIHGPVLSGMPAISLPRVKVEGGESLRMFRDITRGTMDAWRLVDDRFWRLQRVRSEIS